MIETTAFRFTKASCVAVGAFNVYIVQPSWLTAKGLLPKGLEVVMESKLDEPGFRYSSPRLPVRWIVTPTRIMLETENPAEDCGRLMARLLALLPETPVSAVGNNAYYETAPGTARLLAVGDFPRAEARPGDKVARRIFVVGVQRGDCRHNLALTLADDKVELLLNGERQLEGGSPSRLAQEHVANYLEHRRAGIDLARHYMNCTIHG